MHASFMDMRTIGIYELDGTHGKFQQGGQKNLSGRGTTKQERDPFTDLRRLLQSSDLTLTGISDLDWITSKEKPL